MLGVRLDPESERALDALAKRTHRTKSEIVRQLVVRHIRDQDEDLRAEARRQSLRASELDDPEEWAFWESLEAEDGSWK